MDSATDKKTFLLEEPAVKTQSCRSRQVHNPWAVLCILLVILSAVFAAAFVGGYFLGKDKATSKALDSSDPYDTYPHRAYNMHYDGNSHVIPAFRGSLPVEDFIQPRAAVVNGQLVSMPGNPLLTPKGTSQIFVYQYLDEVSLIVTATGPKYGEEVSNASMSGDGQYTLRTSGLQGDLVQLTDGYHQLYDRVPVPNSLAIKLQWGNVGSHGFIFVLNDPSSLDATLDFTSLIGAQQPLNIRGGHMYDTEIAVLPTPNSPLRMTPYTGKFSLNNKPDSWSETSIPGSSDSSNLKLVQLNSNSRRRRSMSTRLSRGMSFVLSDPKTNQLLHKIEITHETRHGGDTGSVCWHVLNNVKGVEGSFCPLFHQALYNGMSDKPSDDSRNSVIVNSHFRSINDDSDLSNTWKQATFLLHDFDPDSVLQSMQPRSKRGFWGTLSNVVHHGSQLISAGRRLYGDYKQVRDGVVDSIHTVHGVINDFNGGSRRKLLWNCGFGDSLLDGGKCAIGGVGCAAGLAGEGPSGGLDTALTAYGCGSAAYDCGSFASRCF